MTIPKIAFATVAFIGACQFATLAAAAAAPTSLNDEVIVTLNDLDLATAAGDDALRARFDTAASMPAGDNDLRDLSAVMQKQRMKKEARDVAEKLIESAHYFHLDHFS